MRTDKEAIVGTVVLVLACTAIGVSLFGALMFWVANVSQALSWLLG